MNKNKKKELEAEIVRYQERVNESKILLMSAARLIRPLARIPWNKGAKSWLAYYERTFDVSGD